MKERFARSQVFTIPNLLSLIRLLLIPIIVWLYSVKEERTTAIILVAISALSDILDGKIARKFNMVSDIGKFLDPLADKLTQAALMLCVYSRYPATLVLLCIFAAKEIYMLVWGIVILKKADVINSAQWHGKATTAFLLSVLAVLLIFPQIPDAAANVLFGLCVGLILLSVVLYTRFYIRLLHGKATKK